MVARACRDLDLKELSTTGTWPINGEPYKCSDQRGEPEAQPSSTDFELKVYCLSLQTVGSKG